jgi:hypothetical protein
MIRLEKWSMIFDIRALLVVGKQTGCLAGFVYGHPKFEDGEEIVTSYIVDLDVRNGRAKTYSGSEYVLGRPHPDWVKWLEKNDFKETLEDLKESEGRLMN